MFANWAAPNTTTLPPDVILELGPPLCPTRYAAHAALIAIHSGYFRAALRTVDNNNSIVSTDSLQRGLQSGLIDRTDTIMSCRLANSPNATTIYLPNVTAEQFSPLLAYMYTGCLELTVGNIFGVLLATHLLHMPRALELCRSFLSSSTISPSSHVPALVPYTLDSHLNSNCYEQKTLALSSLTDALDRPKLVRPIASKATKTAGLSFIAPPMASQISLMPSAPFRSLEQIINVTDMRNTTENSKSPSLSPISVTQCDDDLDPIQSPITKPMEDVHLFATQNQVFERGTTYLKTSPNRQNNVIIGNDDFTIVDHPLQSTNETTAIVKPSPLQRKKSTNVIPETAGDRDNSATGVIVDIASCDGPVRFRRVLNVMYDCNKSNTPSRIAVISSADSEDGLSDAGVKRIDDQRYTTLLRQQVMQDKSSSISTAGSECHNQEPRCQPKMKQKITSHVHQHRPPEPEDLKDENNHQEEGVSSCHSDTLTGRSYTCVYCKYSFKSHYCYQKHAKRHLIPLSSQAIGTATTSSSSESTESLPKVTDIRRRVPRSSFDNSLTMRRQVKPLDMNVQYYPCKTCGSKFPSYYFVHKHRKLCHTEEENETADDMTSMNKEPGTKTLSKEELDH